MYIEYFIKLSLTYKVIDSNKITLYECFQYEEVNFFHKFKYDHKILKVTFMSIIVKLCKLCFHTFFKWLTLDIY